MGTATGSTNITTAPAPARSERSGGGARALVLVATAVAALVGLVVSARLALIVLATPAPIWLVDVSPLIGPPAAADPTVRRLATQLADDFRDSALVRGRYAVCADEIAGATSAGDVQRRAAGLDACLAAVEDGLEANPTSGELWLERARLLAMSGVFDDRLHAALANSYATSPREGWIAATRVVLNLRLQPLLQDVFVSHAADDLNVVLQSRPLAGPLVRAYVLEDALRPRVNAALEKVEDVATQERFVSWVRAEVNASR